VAATRSINDVADDILKLQTKRKKLEDQAELIKKQEDELKLELSKLAEDAKLTFGGNKKSAWNITPSVVPQVSNWDEFYAWIGKKKYFHMLQRRPAVKACQEIWSQGAAIPGVEKFTQMKVNVKET
jgi:hypothetical protein